MNGRSDGSTLVDEPEAESRCERSCRRRRIKRKRRDPEIARRPIRPEMMPPIMAGEGDEDEVEDMDEVGAAVLDREPMVDELHEKLSRSVFDMKLT